MLPSPTGPHRVGCVELDIPAPTAAGRVPVVVYYPAHRDAPSSGLPPPEWLPTEHAAALGRAQLAAAFGPRLGAALLGGLGPVATGFAVVRAERGAAPLWRDGKEGWPCAVLSHSLTGWRHINSSFLVEIASHGAVAVALEHADGSACACVANDDDARDGDAPAAPSCLAAAGGEPAPPPRHLARYVDFARDKLPELLLAELGDDAGDVGSLADVPPRATARVTAAAFAWRHSQLDQRVAEVHATLAGLNAALARAFSDRAKVPHGGGGGGGDDDDDAFARVARDVAVLGMSFGGACAAAVALRDADAVAPVVAHCLLYDPWIEGSDAATCVPLPHADLARESFPSRALRTLTVWSCGRSQLRATCLANCEGLVARAARGARCRAVLHDCPRSPHVAQTDAPRVFESAPLAFVYRAIRGTADDEPSGEAALELATRQTVEALRDWFATPPDEEERKEML